MQKVTIYTVKDYFLQHKASSFRKACINRFKIEVLYKMKFFLSKGERIWFNLTFFLLLCTLI